MPEHGLCKCGCGEKTSVPLYDNRQRGWTKGQPIDFVKGHSGRAPLEHRFWERVTPGGPDECWEWQGSRGHLGHGRLKFRGKSLGAHRISWQLANGPIPDGLLICHRCDNPPCVNPAHLFLGTHKDNLDDMRAKGRDVVVRGTRVGTSKLNERHVAAIKTGLAEGRSQNSLAAEFGVSQSAIYKINVGASWAWVKAK